MQITSKLAQNETTIFTVMSAMAKQYQAVNLGQGFPDYDCDVELKQLVSKHLNAGKNQYAPMAGVPALRDAIRQKIAHTHQADIDADTQICITAGATQAIFTAILAFVRSGEEVIVIEPAFDCYLPAIQLAGGIPKIYSMRYPDYQIDWEALGQLISDRTSMILINSPHNPTGTILRKEDLLQLERLVVGKDIIVLSDEVYEHLIYDDESHQSVLRFPNLMAQSIAVFSFGKTFHATGWKIGYCVGAPNLIAEFKNIHQWNVFSVNSFVQHAIAEYLENPASYELLPDFFQTKRNLLTEVLEDVPMQPKLSEGTYFQLYHYAEISDQDDFSFAKHLTRSIGVTTIPLSPFYTNPPDDQVIRLCFAKKESTLLEAANRLKKLNSYTIRH
ncbi:MAG: methionine aminotransferase [Bacteroidota bacterium]